MDNSLEEIKTEYFRLVDARQLETSLKFQRQMLMGAITGKDPDLVGDYVATAIEQNQLYILTDAKERAQWDGRIDNVRKAFDYTAQRDAREASKK